ncbi:unnamed protein product [Choristocarpus tenellus]
MFEDYSSVPIVKVIDFGLCANLKGGITSRAFVGTRLYVPPEMVKADKHALPCDLWAVGVMTYELVSNSYPFYSEDADVLGHLVKTAKHKYPEEKFEGVSTLCKDFIDKCLVKNPSKRITAKQAMEHPWIKRAKAKLESLTGRPLGKGALLAMKKFQSANIFKKVAMELVAQSYEPQQITELELDFLKMDVSGTGYLTLGDFKSAICCRRISVSRSGKSPKADCGGSKAPLWNDDGTGRLHGQEVSGSWEF